MIKILHRCARIAAYASHTAKGNPNQYYNIVVSMLSNFALKHLTKAEISHVTEQLLAHLVDEATRREVFGAKCIPLPSTGAWKRTIRKDKRRRRNSFRT